eukprot:CAMPEP_0115549310 /NCGR_PEP_ID=MMETSP0271-20121206/94627_1 /TAXON_ID=71861 /ORGANISM="Scrippsiella trochoidea, Strain CCMP3099" /LENGTH=163 /DNA_ID=CAMNT_0002982831 /DNA_START=24 /DNA_END=512 /DNA_ORIENTATION=+
MEENGAKFEVDVLKGHKTGFFLDQREHRGRIREQAAGREVLDLFTYTGGFAISAALGGASRTVAVDQASLAIEACRRNFALNGLEAAVVRSGGRLSAGGEARVGGVAHSLHVADCWKFLEEASARGDRFDIIISDPPSMAPSARTRGRALKAYAQINERALRV